MSLRSIIESNKFHLQQMENINNKYLEIKLKYDEFFSATKFSRDHLNRVKILDNIIENSRSAFSDNILNSLKQSLSKCINIILQEKEYDIDIEIYQYRGNPNLRIWLIDEEGRKLPPNIVEGDMLNQVLSFCASVIMTKLNGCNWIYYDEAFASANSRSVIMIRKLIRTFLEEGFNFVFVGQNPLLFTEFDRNLIELVQEDGNVVSVVQSFITATKDESLDEKVLELHDQLLRG